MTATVTHRTTARPAHRPGQAPVLRVHPGPAESALPDPEQWAGALVRSSVEVLRGMRPVAQLARWLSPELYDAVARRAGAVGEHPSRRRATSRRATIRRVHVCRVSARVVECSVVVHDGTHLRAAAVRLEVYRGRWRATALQIG